MTLERTKGKFEKELPYGNHRIRIATTFPMLASWDDVPVRTIPVGTHKFQIQQAKGTLTLDVTEPKDYYGIEIVSRESQPGEKIDDLPPPEPPAPDSFLKQMRQKIMQERAFDRENFDGALTPYQLVEQDFEEELAARDLSKRKEHNDALKQQKDEETGKQKSSPADEGSNDPGGEKPPNGD